MHFHYYFIFLFSSFAWFFVFIPLFTCLLFALFYVSSHTFGSHTHDAILFYFSSEWKQKHKNHFLFMFQLILCRCSSHRQCMMAAIIIVSAAQRHDTGQLNQCDWRPSCHLRPSLIGRLLPIIASHPFRQAACRVRLVLVLHSFHLYLFRRTQLFIIISFYACNKSSWKSDKPADKSVHCKFAMGARCTHILLCFRLQSSHGILKALNGTRHTDNDRASMNLFAADHSKMNNDYVCWCVFRCHFKIGTFSMVAGAVVADVCVVGKTR